jgi:hypothetical protein
LVRPAPVSGFPHWGLILNDASDDRPGKTGVSDEAIVVDTPEMAPLLAALLEAHPAEHSLWDFDAQQLRLRFSDAMVTLNMADGNHTLYELRHGGASHDLLARRRTLAQVKERGRWVADTSLRRYAKATRMQQRVNDLDPSIDEFGCAVLAHLPSLIEATFRSGRFPLAAPSVPGRLRARPVRIPPVLTQRWTPS